MVTITKQTPDFIQIHPLFQQLWPQKHFDPKKWKHVYEEQIKEGKEYLIALDKDTLIGFINIRFEHGFKDEGKVAFFDEFVVDETWRGKGVGSKLLKEAQSYMKDKGCKAVYFESAFHRTESYEFYLKRGFQKVATYFKKTL